MGQKPIRHNASIGSDDYITLRSLDGLSIEDAVKELEMFFNKANENLDYQYNRSYSGNYDKKEKPYLDEYEGYYDTQELRVAQNLIEKEEVYNARLKDWEDYKKAAEDKKKKELEEKKKKSATGSKAKRRKMYEQLRKEFEND